MCCHNVASRCSPSAGKAKQTLYASVTSFTQARRLQRRNQENEKLNQSGNHGFLRTPADPHEVRCDAPGTAVVKNIVGLCSHSALTMTNQVMGIVGWLTTTRTRLCLYPSACISDLPSGIVRSPHEQLRRLRSTAILTTVFFCGGFCCWWT